MQWRFFLKDCGTYDPENLLGALPTIFLAYLGIQAGRILGSFTDYLFDNRSAHVLFSVLYDNHIDRLIRLFIWSIVTVSIGIGLTSGKLNDGPMPLNKNIWTLSFSLFTGKE